MNVQEKENQYIFQTYGRIPLTLVRGEGPWVWDQDNKRYLDFVGGLAVNALGHCHPAVVEAVQSQVGQMLHCSNLYYTAPQADLAEILVNNSCCERVFFCNSGAEANEAAIKLARKYSYLQYGADRKNIISTTNSFHGRTMATITATGQPKYHQGFDPLLPGFHYVPFGDLDALQQAMTPQTCGVLIEPIQGEGGVNVADQQYWQGLRQLCTDNDVALIFDEVQVGMGRTGTLFAYQGLGVEPDIITLAKALGGGLPIGAMMAKGKVADAFQPGDHASTFGGNPLVASGALAVVRTMLEENLPEQAREKGTYLQEQLAHLQAKFSRIKQIRGQGLIIGIELQSGGGDIVKSCQDKGLLINCTAGHVLRLLPPLNVEKEQIDQALGVLTAALMENPQQ